MRGIEDRSGCVHEKISVGCEPARTIASGAERSSERFHAWRNENRVGGDGLHQHGVAQRIEVVARNRRSAEHITAVRVRIEGDLLLPGSEPSLTIKICEHNSAP